VKTLPPVYLTILILAAVALSLVPASADGFAEEVALPDTFVTPHIKWAQPYAQGQVRVLYFSVGVDTWGRDIIELRQRFDIEAAVVFWGWKGTFAGDQAGHERLLELLERPYDCYLFQGKTLQDLTSEEQAKILERVLQGAGLVVVGANDPRVVKPENRIQPLPAFLGTGTAMAVLPCMAGRLGDLPAERQNDAGLLDELLAAYRIGEGRGVQMAARPELPYRRGWQVEYEQWIQLVGRAALWTAGREPQINLTLGIAAQSLERAELPARAGRLTWDNPTGEALTLQPVIRPLDGETVPLPVKETSAPSGSLELEIPELPTGNYILQVQVNSRRGAEAWGTASFRVQADQKVLSVALDQPVGEIGERIRGSVRLQNPAPKSLVRVELLDSSDRILARRDLRLYDNRVRFHFPTYAWMPMFMWVRATLLQGEQPVAQAHTGYHLTKRYQDQFNFVMWDMPRSATLAPYAEQRLADAGVTVHLWTRRAFLPWQNDLLSANNLAWALYMTRIGFHGADKTPHDEQGVMLPHCWNSPEAIEAAHDNARFFKAHSEHGVFVYSLGDEVAVRGTCTSPYCLDAYRNYLQQEYGTIQALNAEWASDFANFGAVQPLNPGQYNAEAALAEGNSPRWYDRQRFSLINFVNYCQRWAEVIREYDLQFKLGFEGAGRLRDRLDYEALIRTNDFWGPYPSLGDEVIRSLAPRDFVRSNWMGYSREAEPLLAKYWRMILNGCNSVWWWRWDGIGQFHGLLAPHLDYYPASRALIEDTCIVREGLGDLLLQCEMLDDGIALLYSLPSTYATSLENEPAYGDFVQDHAFWQDAVRELGMQFDYVSDQMLDENNPRLNDYRVLVLIRAAALSDQSAQVIRRWVEQGGTLIADLPPGLFDGHCKLRDQGVLDDLFGIRRTGESKARVSSVQLPVALQAEAQHFKLENRVYNPDVRAAGAEALGSAGETPLVLVNHYGQGQTILLNLSARRLRGSEQEEVIAEFVRSLFAAGGVAPSLRETDLEGNRLPGLDTVRWQTGDIELMAVFQPGFVPVGSLGSQETGAEDSRPALLHLPEPQHVYDLRQGKYLGHTDLIHTQLRVARTSWFALSPTRVHGPQVRLSSRRLQRGGTLVATCQVPGAVGLHALRLRLIAPNRAEAKWFSQNLIVGPDPTEVSVPLAYNDPAGQWQLEVRDLYTGQVAQARFEVR